MFYRCNKGKLASPSDITTPRHLPTLFLPVQKTKTSDYFCSTRPETTYFLTIQRFKTSDSFCFHHLTSRNNIFFIDTTQQS
eukprot:m.212741 g.212741  ORF g.212741 m.212741 type:complete len:81 (+) comp33134_c0_seq4:1204-1446(+)